MSPFRKVLAQVLHLKPKQRAAIADKIVESLAGPIAPEIEESWKKEIDRRLHRANSTDLRMGREKP